MTTYKSEYTSEYYRQLVPTDEEANLHFRRYVLESARGNPEEQAVLRCMCQRDVLFYVNVFAWTYDPRLKPGYQIVPFITWDAQNDVLIKLRDNLGRNHVFLEKSRDTGGSWLPIAFKRWRFNFYVDESYLFVSRTADYVEKPGNPKSLFWKFDFLGEWAPRWLTPLYDPDNHDCRQAFHRYNPDTRTVVDGEATSGNVGRGDRRTMVMMDEFATFDDVKPGMGTEALGSVFDVTNNCVFVSTPKGVDNAFYDMKQRSEEPNSPIISISLHWSTDPRKSAGLYTADENGELKILDEDYRYPDNYEFVLDMPGSYRVRSPWYDRECRVRSPRLVAEQLDLDYHGSGRPLFDLKIIEQLKANHATVARHRGNIRRDPHTLEPQGITHNEAGALYLWCEYERGGKVPPGEYVVGCDISNGTGASNSCASVVNARTGEKVGEYVTPYLKPHAFAKDVIALCRMFHDAYLIWECNGPGQSFRDEVLDRGYSNLHYRENTNSISRRVTDNVGWWSTKTTKQPLLEDYAEALSVGRFLNPSEAALNECRAYRFAKGRIEHSSAATTDDLSGAGDNHGDRVIADAVAWHAVKDIISGSVRAAEDDVIDFEPPVGSFAWRVLQEESTEPAYGAW